MKLNKPTIIMYAIVMVLFIGYFYWAVKEAKGSLFGFASVVGMLFALCFIGTLVVEQIEKKKVN